MNSTTKQIARQRINILFQQAKLTYKTNPDQAKKYLQTARKIAMSARIRLPNEHKRSICKTCNSLLVPGESCRIRTRAKREPHIVITCLNCGSQTRIPLKTKNNLEEKENEQNNHQDETSCQT